jgi:hypothetical protein
MQPCAACCSAAQPNKPTLLHVSTPPAAARRAQAAGKPLLLEEFGVWGGQREERNTYYRLIYDAIAQVPAQLPARLFDRCQQCCNSYSAISCSAMSLAGDMFAPPVH